PGHSTHGLGLSADIDVQRGGAPVKPDRARSADKSSLPAWGCSLDVRALGSEQRAVPTLWGCSHRPAPVDRADRVVPTCVWALRRTASGTARAPGPPHARRVLRNPAR